MDQSSGESIQASCRAVPAERKAEYVKFLRGAQDNIKLGWTQGATARDYRGANVAAADESACSFCLYGALWRLKLRLPDAVVSALYGALLKIEPEKGEEIGLIGFNDTPGRTQEEVIGLFDEAIRMFTGDEPVPAPTPEVRSGGA
jgi:hypothetical protein